MIRLRRHRPAPTRINEACGCACDSGCQANARLDRAHTHAMTALGGPR
jgi:hypothetical protein